jgi:hypothetical protein
MTQRLLTVMQPVKFGSALVFWRIMSSNWSWEVHDLRLKQPRPPGAVLMMQPQPPQGVSVHSCTCFRLTTAQRGSAMTHAQTRKENHA